MSAAVEEPAQPGEARTPERRTGQHPAAPVSERRAARLSGQRPGRVAGVDTTRGLLLIASVTTSSLLVPPEWFDHAPWIGVHPLDLVFPAFVVLTGAGLGFAHKNGVRVPRLVRRVLVLFVLGLLYNTAGDLAQGYPFRLETVRVTGVLQLYALLVLVIALLHLVVRSCWGWLAVAIGLGAAHTALTALTAASCPGGLLTPECNPSAVVDGLLPASHLYQQMGAGHDPEGLVATLGACATAAAGTALAHALTAARRTSDRPSHALPRLLIIAGALGSAALLAHLLVPDMKRLWTAPFGLGVAAATVVVVTVVHLAVDGRWTAGAGPAAAWVRAARWPLVALGRNSLLVYFGSHVLVDVLRARPLPDVRGEAGTWAEQIGQATSLLGGVQVGLTLTLLAGWWVLAMLMHRRGWYVRA
ncbi:heparan-alpha-glucosaminide N-acetyltransferase domain-containing protein [Quadrisphaera sp. KR29]|uniref:heparan-alpha-glucosaminide N-acetyltransferase domain-containing protein n=1 Tax=Quadrisphaera sp. KR29 TaxID=3461391 RepID=UPI00404440D1